MSRLQYAHVDCHGAHAALQIAAENVDGAVAGEPLLFGVGCREWLAAKGDSNDIEESKLAKALHIQPTHSGPRHRRELHERRCLEEPHGVKSSTRALRLEDLDRFTRAMVQGLLALEHPETSASERDKFAEKPLVFWNQLRATADGKARLQRAVASVECIYDSYHCRPEKGAGGPFYLRDLLPSSANGGQRSISLSKANLRGALAERDDLLPVCCPFIAGAVPRVRVGVPVRVCLALCPATCPTGCPAGCPATCPAGCLATCPAGCLAGCPAGCPGGCPEGCPAGLGGSAWQGLLACTCRAAAVC